jgi:hypothetical protein
MPTFETAPPRYDLKYERNDREQVGDGWKREQCRYTCDQCADVGPLAVPEPALGFL